MVDFQELVSTLFHNIQGYILTNFSRLKYDLQAISIGICFSELNLFLQKLCRNISFKAASLKKI